MIKNTETTHGLDYAQYLIQNQNSLKSLILQLPYRLHLQFLKLGVTLDIGCGAGRNLKVLAEGSVGIDHNALLVEACQKRGLKCLTTEDFLTESSIFTSAFDSILISHVAEHMSRSDFSGMLKEYRRFLKPGGRVIVICPQEKGYASDSTHVHFMDFTEIKKALNDADYVEKSHYSFPFPRVLGKVFTHNEFVVTAKGG